MKLIFMAVLVFFIAPSIGAALAITFTNVGDGWIELNLPSWFVYAACISATSFVCSYWLAVRAGVIERDHRIFGSFAVMLLLVTVSVAFISGTFTPSAALTVSAAGPDYSLNMIKALFDDFVPQLLQLFMGLSCFIFAATAIHMLVLAIKAYRSLTF